MASRALLAAQPITAYLSQIQQAASNIAPYDPAYYHALVNSYAEAAKNALIGVGADSAAQMANDANALAFRNDVAQSTLPTMENTQAPQSPFGQVTPPVNAPPSVPGGGAPPVPQDVTGSQQHGQDLLNAQVDAQKQYSDALKSSSNNAAYQAQVLGADTTRKAGDVLQQNVDNAHAAVDQAAQQASGGSGGGGRGGRGGGGGGGGFGGGGGGGDTLTAGQEKMLAQVEQGPVDWRSEAAARRGAFGDRGPVKPKNAAPNYGLGAQDFLFGAEGGAKGHVAPDLSNVDDILQKQLAWVDKQRKAGKKVGYTKASLIKLANDLKGKVAAAGKDLRTQDLNTMQLQDLGIIGMDEPTPGDIAKLQSAQASNPGPSQAQLAANQKKWNDTIAANQRKAAAQPMIDRNALGSGQNAQNALKYFASHPAALAAWQNRDRQRHPRGYAGKRPGPG